MSRLRVGIVGGGFMATVHSRAARAAGAELAGIVSSSPTRGAAAAEALGIERAFPDLDALLGEVDVVHVCTPNAFHAEQALAVARAGVHVVCEKPLATTVADSRQLVRAASGVTATVPFVYRFHPLVREARARVASGEAGRVLSIRASYLQDWLLSADDDNWRVDPETGGRSRAFADIGSHLVDLLEFITGDPIARVAATRRTFVEKRAEHAAVSTEDAAAVTIETAGGAIGTLLVSQAAPGRKNALTLEIAGSAESIAFEQENPETIWVGRRGGSLSIPRDADQLSPDAARLCTVPAGHPQGYQDAFNAFVADSYAAIAGGEPEGLPRFTDGLRAVQLTETVMDAAERGAWLDVPSEGDTQ
ncbi:Predicted dehydrogenase [Paramicrobacterium humi]|uniref:Predicted dehydrogenase n=1 Tax=Paramicrobacterium humi TaxID=640635 RepID=A0A1H4J851_9MICO|nr:Gfo/Idh/MocA family oxidoreductase [Microbacterium humi]SEB42529.1 Predicted dehydrogenase [Microbacterium humi]